MPAERAREKVVNEGTAHERVTSDHDAFGRLTLARSQGSQVAMFGSALKHVSYVSIELARCRVDRHLNRDWIFGDDTIVRLRMSEAQWARFVASSGMGEGTPCTLEYAPARGTPVKRMPELIMDPIKKTHEDEVRKAARQASEGVRAAEAAVREMLKPGAKSTKKDLEALLDKLRAAGDHFEGNMGFAQESFVGAMERTVEDAKTEVEAFVGTVATRTGLEALRGGGMSPLLIEADAATDEANGIVEAGG